VHLAAVGMPVEAAEVRIIKKLQQEQHFENGAK
jgi:hypothetical protein